MTDDFEKPEPPGFMRLSEEDWRSIAGFIPTTEQKFPIVSKKDPQKPWSHGKFHNRQEKFFLPIHYRELLTGVYRCQNRIPFNFRFINLK